MKCAREGCGETFEPSLNIYCSDECHRLDRKFAVERMSARLRGEEPPTMEDILQQKKRSKRWSPDTMQARILEFRLQA